VKPPSERSTGLVFAGVALLLALVWRHHPTAPWWALAIAAVVGSISFLAPQLLKPLNVIWFKLGLLLHRIVNPVVMLALFIFVFVPAGALMRLWHDPLRSRRQPGASSYWLAPNKGEASAGSMTNQF
jgi:hypothetical protein